MDEFSQAARDGNLDILEQYIQKGDGNIKEAFSEALQSEQLASIDYLMPYMPVSHLRYIANESRSKGNIMIADKISLYLTNPRKSIPFAGCMITRDQFMKYEIDYNQPLGEGSYGKVYVGVYTPYQLPIAIKVMYKQYIHPTDIDIIQHECQILFKLDHPNIIKIYGGYEDDDAYYWMLTLMNGGTLYEYVYNRGNLTLDASINILRQLVDAVNYCHLHDIIHRDIKPENILIHDVNSKQNSLRIVLSDFGYATSQKIGEVFTNYVGTLYYQSPEIILQEAYDGRAADIWAIGITLYFIYFGVVPFHEPNFNLKILFDDPVYTGDEMSTYLNWILQKDPNNRPSIQNIIRSFDFNK